MLSVSFCEITSIKLSISAFSTSVLSTLTFWFRISCFIFEPCFNDVYNAYKSTFFSQNIFKHRHFSLQHSKYLSSHPISNITTLVALVFSIHDLNVTLLTNALVAVALITAGIGLANIHVSHSLVLLRQLLSLFSFLHFLYLIRGLSCCVSLYNTAWDFYQKWNEYSNSTNCSTEYEGGIKLCSKPCSCNSSFHCVLRTRLYEFVDGKCFLSEIYHSKHFSAHKNNPDILVHYKTSSTFHLFIIISKNMKHAMQKKHFFYFPLYFHLFTCPQILFIRKTRKIIWPLFPEFSKIYNF